jgi:hypothetical protein
MSALPSAQPAYGTPENDLIVQVLLEVSHVLATPRPWPDARTLLAALEENESIGWRARWALPLAVARLRKQVEAFENEQELSEYLHLVLSDAALADAIRGEAEKEKEFKSTIDDLFRNSAAYRDSAAFQEMMDFCARFRAYAPFNNMLVRLQNRSCAFYATEKHWQDAFDCVLKEDARPLLILAPMHPVMLVYDLDSVENPPLPEKLRAFGSVEGQWDPARLPQLLDNAEKWAIRVAFKTLSTTHGGFATLVRKKSAYKMRIAVHDGLDARGRYGVLCHELAHILLGHLGSDHDLWWPSRRDLDQRTVEIEAEAVAHIVLTRAGLKSASVPYLSSYVQDGTVPPTVSMDLITKVAGKIEDMSLHSKSAPKLKAPAKKK